MVLVMLSWFDKYQDRDGCLPQSSTFSCFCNAVCQCLKLDSRPSFDEKKKKKKKKEYRRRIIIRRPASALLDKLLCPPGPGGPAAAG